jgi:hypothetical protein
MEKARFDSIMLSARVPAIPKVINKFENGDD